VLAQLWGVALHEQKPPSFFTREGAAGTSSTGGSVPSRTTPGEYARPFPIGEASSSGILDHPSGKKPPLFFLEKRPELLFADGPKSRLFVTCLEASKAMWRILPRRPFLNNERWSFANELFSLPRESAFFPSGK